VSSFVRTSAAWVSGSSDEASRPTHCGRSQFTKLGFPGYIPDPDGVRRKCAEQGDVIAHIASGEEILRYEPAAPMVGTTGDIEAISLWAGQSVALARQPQPAAAIVAELVSRL
jgi:hypothetical protein